MALRISLCLFIVLSGLLSGCVKNTTTKVQNPKDRFSLKQKARCLQFVDQSTGLSFCVPPNTSLRLSRFRAQAPTSFEVRLLVSKSAQQNKGSIEIRVRRDLLPEDLPEGALRGRWLKRYAESYAMRRGTLRSHMKTRVLRRKKNRFLHTDSAAWAGFPLTNDDDFAWEEVLVLAKKNPATRYLISLRMAASERSVARRGSLRKFFKLFLQHLRLGKPSTTDPM